MAVNGITSAINSRMRLSGLSSGLDTDTMVKQMMAADVAKIDKLIAKRQIDLWKMDSYRDISSTLQGFYTEYFDSLSAKNLKSENSYASFSATFANAESSQYLDITPGASAKTGTYNIKSIKAATSATLSGTNVTNETITAQRILNTDVANIKASNFNNRFSFTFNDNTVEFTLNDTETYDNISDLKSELQEKLNNAFGGGKIEVNIANGDTTGGKLTFKTARNTDSFSIGTVFNGGVDAIFGVKPSTTSPVVLNEGNNKFQMTINGVTKTIAIPLVDESNNPKTSFSNASELATAVQRGLNAAFGSNSGVVFVPKDDQITYTVLDEDIKAGISQFKDFKTNAALGINPTNMSNKLDLAANISDIKGGFVPPLNGDVNGVGEDIKFTINGIAFGFNSKETSINKILDTINSNTDLKVIMKYDFTSNSFKLQSKGSGVTDKLTVVDTNGNLMGSLLGSTLSDTGTDAEVQIEGMDLIVRSSNVFSYDGLNFTIKKDYSEADHVSDPIKATVNSDTTKTYDFIKGFVEKYNELVGKLNSKINEKVNKDYTPLTDEQKASMSDDQVEKWEEKAKSGILKNDSILTSTLSKLRSALYDSIAGVGISLSSIGITTSSDYGNGGKLEIDERKLKEALANKPDEVARLFTANSDKSYYDVLNNSMNKAERYKETGIAQRFGDIIQDAIRTNTDINGYKGSLLEKAGIVDDRSETTNQIYKEISSFDKQIKEMNSKLADKENALYAKFTAMETALSRMNSQSAWLTQQFSGNSGS